LIPFLGQIKLSELTSRQLNAIFAEIGKVSNRFGKPTSTCTLQHLRTTLRAALNAAIREGLITDNPARRVELPTRRRPHPLVWTEHRVADWQDFGARPAVAVWKPQQLAEFLDFVRDERLFALWWLVALRGLRRGEAAGLRWSDVDLDQGQLEIVRQRTTAGHQVIECAPKSAASARIVALDKHTVRALRTHASRQRQERDRRLTAGKEWVDSGYVFTRADGTPIHPTYLTQRMRTLVQRAGLPPIRLHDLRHGAASLAHTAGADLKVLQDQLGHASIVMTADIYTSVLPRSQRKAAEATARLVLAAAGRDRKKIKRSGRRSRPVPPRKSAAPGLRPRSATEKSQPTPLITARSRDTAWRHSRDTHMAQAVHIEHHRHR
jgi:integrase